MKQVQKSDLETLIGRAAPVVFVLLWCTGFIGTKYVLNSAEPLTYLTVRMMLAAAIMAVIVAWVRPAWPDRAGIGHSIIAGLLVQGLYLAGTVFAVAHKVPVGLSALIPGLQPILTSILASRFLGERVTPLQWGGVALGLAGVLLILHGRPMTGEAGWGWFASAISLITITVGTLYQKRYCGGIDWRAGNVIQYIGAGALFALGAFAFETLEIHWTGELIFALAWLVLVLVLVLSIAAVGLMYWLIRRSTATGFESLFFLMPAVTALFA
jgi:drug/metabolite transporter (DMT)-like permease